MLGCITIEKMKFNDISLSLNYQEDKEGFLVAHSPDFSLKSTLSNKEDILSINIQELNYLKRNIKLFGNLYFNLKDIELYSNLNINVHNDVRAKIFIQLNTQKLLYKLITSKEIKSIKYLMESFNLPKEVKFWVLDAIDMDYVTIQSAKGFIDFNHPKDALNNLYIQAKVHKLNYTYNTSLDAIHTEVTYLEFKHAILFIRPKNAYSSNQFLDKSWLKIDFTKKDELLTLYLLFEGMLNKEMLNVLKTYKINLPFLQHTGKVKTNLKLEVGLRSISVDAKGDFFAPKANFDYLGLNIDIHDAYIKLNNYDVKINHMRASYKDIATSSVDVVYNAHTSKGTIIFNADKIIVPNKGLFLSKTPLKITYEMNPKQDSIHVEKSFWKHDKTLLSIDAITLPFDLDKLILNIPTTFFDAKETFTGYLEGKIDLKGLKAFLNVDLLTFKYSNIQLNESNAQLKIKYDKKLTISSKNPISFNMDDIDINLQNATVEINGKSIFIKNTYLNIDNSLYAKINSTYKIGQKINKVDLKYLHLKNGVEQIYSKNNLHLIIEQLKDMTTIYSDDLSANLRLYNHKWVLKVNKLEKLVKGSKYLQNLKFRHGNAVINKNSNEEKMTFKAEIDYDYSFLIINNKPIKKYIINGEINNNKVKLNINKKINVNIDKNININIEDSGLNVSQIIKLTNDINITENNSTNKNINLQLNAKNVYFNLGNNRRIIADNVELQYVNNITTAQLKHAKGSAGFKLQDKTFHLYGNKFNDKFMENIFSMSKFKGGELEFSIKGSLDDYSGTFYINNTTILNYKLLNNVLAFVNTVPALVTFSIPGYNNNGLYVDASYAKFHAKNNVFNISDFLVDSKEIDIFGKGVADITNDKIDVNLNLKTDLGSSVRKIPIVGYILLDGDSISTSVHVTGKLSNPEVNSMLAKDIIVAPLNIIKRTILLPFKLFTDLVGDSNSSK
ncbi:MAG: AsmA-like C-terminal domain-containing protein [Sulfurimonas sp.]